MTTLHYSQLNSLFPGTQIALLRRITILLYAYAMFLRSKEYFLISYQTTSGQSVRIVGIIGPRKSILKPHSANNPVKTA